MQHWADISMSREPLSEKRSYFEAKIDHFIRKRLFFLFLISPRFGHIWTLTITQLEFLTLQQFFMKKRITRIQTWFIKQLSWVKQKLLDIQKNIFSSPIWRVKPQAPVAHKERMCCFFDVSKIKELTFSFDKKDF